VSRDAMKALLGAVGAPASGDKNGRGGLADFLGDVTVRKLRHWKWMDRGVFRDLDNACFPVDESFKNDDTYHWWVVFIGKTPVAYAGMAVEKSKGKQIVSVKFTRCGVLPDYRGHGFQRRLIAARISWCRRRGVKEIKTYCALHNTQSKANLITHGFSCRRGSEWFTFRKVL
jgi:GNAT superfamily N-acetyltransferase